MNKTEVVFAAVRHCESFPDVEPITVEEAAVIVGNMYRSPSVPVLTAEEYAAEWNRLISIPAVLDPDMSDEEAKRFIPWYAVMTDPDDTDWGTGSRDLDEAKAMVRRNLDIYPDGYIAVIVNGVCTEIYDTDDCIDDEDDSYTVVPGDTYTLHAGDIIVGSVDIIRINEATASGDFFSVTEVDVDDDGDTTDLGPARWITDHDLLSRIHAHTGKHYKHVKVI